MGLFKKTSSASLATREGGDTVTVAGKVGIAADQPTAEQSADAPGTTPGTDEIIDVSDKVDPKPAPQHQSAKVWPSLKAMRQVSLGDPFAACDADKKIGTTAAFEATLKRIYPGAMNHEEAAVAIKALLRKRGFTEHSSIALVSQCRDEITKPFTQAIDTNWMGSFNISSLAGAVFTGKTGFTAAIHHAPQNEAGEERYVVFCGPHVAIDAEGNVGKVERRGRKGCSMACGALVAFCNELGSGTLDVNDQPLDVEFCNLKRTLLSGLNVNAGSPSLDGLTKVCHDTTVRDVRQIMTNFSPTPKTQHAVVSGILVHGPNYSNYFWPGVIEVITPDGTEDLREELLNAKREDYTAEMIKYLQAKADSARTGG